MSAKKETGNLNCRYLHEDMGEYVYWDWPWYNWLILLGLISSLPVRYSLFYSFYGLFAVSFAALGTGMNKIIYGIAFALVAIFYAVFVAALSPMLAVIFLYQVVRQKDHAV